MKLLEYRFRPKSDYYMQAPWQELYKRIEHLKREISFYEIEINFYIKLVIAFHHSEDQNLVKTEQLVKDAGEQVTNINSQIDEHLGHIAKFIEGGDKTQDLLYREEHNLLEDTISSFINSFRDIRGKLFSEIEKYLQQPVH